MSVTSAPDFLGSRNDPYGFALRTRKNLENILAAYSRGADVHPVTQVTCSLTGIAVFPWEYGHKLADIKTPISEAFVEQPLQYEVMQGHIETLGQLWRTVRNAVSHRGVEFSSDSRDLEEVTFCFRSGYIKNSELVITNMLAMRGDQVLRFCYGILEYIEEH